MQNAYVNRAAQQWSQAQSPLDLSEQVWIGFVQLVDFRDASSEVFGGFAGQASRQQLIAAVQTVYPEAAGSGETW